VYPFRIEETLAFRYAKTRRDFLRSSALTTLGVLCQRTAWSESAQLPNISLGSAFKAKGMLFGFAVNDHRLADDAVYRGLIERHASIVVAENAMKWQALRPAPGQFEFTRANVIADFAQTQRMKLRGHALCWHRGLPDWFQKTATPENAKALLVDHIQTVAGHFAGRIHSWDVVNEAIRLEDKQADGLRDSIWHRLLGESYIDTAFHAARQADAKALLTYNDYGLEYDNGSDEAHRAAVLALLRRLKQRGVPVDAVGIQSHMRSARGERFGKGVVEFISAARGMGLKVMLTELDVDDSSQPASIEARDNTVADVYSRYLQAALGTGEVTAVLSWGVQDPASLAGEMKSRSDGMMTRPFLFDPQGQPTAACHAVLQAASQARKHNQD
jgi:endo-1,4-beta-xylanase